MRFPARRLSLLALASLMMATLVPFAPVAASEVDTSATEIAKAEQGALNLINRHRADRGLVALRLDSRIAGLADERADYMARTGTFSHTHEGGTSVFDMIAAAGIKWYGAGEIIAWNNAEDLAYSTAWAVKGWMGSASHKAIMLSTGYNYFGLGLAIASNGRRYWAGVFLKGPDRTPATAAIKSVSRDVLDARRTRVVVRWGGADRRLQVLTSGLRYFQMQRRVNGRAWYTYPITTSTSMTRRWVRGNTIEFRVRARDKAGNWGTWKTVTIKP